jgi:hypothetical protein
MKFFLLPWRCRFNNWSLVGGAFVAPALTTSQEVDVQETGRFFRLYEIQQ